MQRMKLKNKSNNKKKRLFKFRYLLYLGLVYLSFSISYYFSMKYSNVISDKDLVNILLSDGDISSLYNNEPTKIVSKTMNFLLNIDISSPSSILDTTIMRYGSNNSKTNKTNKVIIEDEEDYTLDEVEKASNYIEDPNPNSLTTKNPIIYLYNSHQLENYSSEYLEIYGITPNVQMASYILKEKLNEKGYNTIVEDADITGLLRSKNWAYYQSYDVTRDLIKEKMSNYSSLKYFIDLHRDSVPKSATTINIGDKYYAKVLFVLGLENKNYNENLKLMESLNGLIGEMYPGLSRGILKKEGEGVNGVYNQNINSNVILIEVGSVDNTIEEVYNTMNALSEVLIRYIGDGNN